MKSTDTTGPERFFDGEIAAFLTREAERRVRNRPADADVVAAIRRRRSRRWPSLALAGVIALSVVVAIGVLASSLVFGPSARVGSSLPPAASGSLQLPVITAGQPCPVSQPTAWGTGQSVLFGDGPVRLALASSAGRVFFEATPGGRWKAIDILWTAEPGFTGEVLVRGAGLDGADELGFADAADPLKELRIRSSAPATTFDGRLLLATTPVRVKGAGCYGLEIDTGGHISIVIFEARPIEDAFAQLERPLQLPAGGSADCSVTPSTEAVPFMPGARGDGPVYLAAGGRFSIGGSRQSGGFWFVKNAWVAAPTELGPILVRGGRIDAPGDLRFGDGSDPARQLQLPIHSYEHTPGQPPGWRLFVGYLRPPSAGCYALQLDTLTESLWLVFEVTR